MSVSISAADGAGPKSSPALKERRGGRSLRASGMGVGLQKRGVARIERKRNPGLCREVYPGFRFTQSGKRLLGSDQSTHGRLDIVPVLFKIFVVTSLFCGVVAPIP